MLLTTSKAITLLNSCNWVSAVALSTDSEPKVVRAILLECSRIMLPYWEARFTLDDSMETVVALIARVAADPSLNNRSELKEVIQRRTHRYWGLSVPDGLVPEDIHSDCPADFAGDSIFYAACSVSFNCFPDSDDCRSALDSAVESLARLFIERNCDDDNTVNYNNDALVFLKDKIEAELKKVP